MPKNVLPFSQAMVRALWSGQKTEDRRLVTLNGEVPDFCGPSGTIDDPTSWGWLDSEHGDWITLEKEPDDRMGWRDWIGAPQAGGRLLVQEAYGIDKNRIWYRLDHEEASGPGPRADVRWRSAAQMPSRLARLVLEIKEVRIQRLQDITLSEICAEGLARSIYDFKPVQRGFTAYQAHWNRRHKKAWQHWGKNPWVYVLSFEAVRSKADAAFPEVRSAA